MKEFINKLIARLEEIEKAPIVESPYNYGWKNACQVMKNAVNELAEEYRQDTTFQYVLLQTDIMKRMGIDVSCKWETATQQTSALNEAYMRGRQDERDRFAEWQDEHCGGWIPCSERLPEANQMVLTCDKDGWVSVHVYLQYKGKKNDFECGYYEAWMPLPPAYIPKGDNDDHSKDA